MELINWPPSRGPNPNAPKVTYRQGKIERQDISREDRRKIERDFNQAKPAMIGIWRTWFQVEDVADLTLSQAVRLLKGKKAGDKSVPVVCADDWYEEEFGGLVTIINYPLETAVQLSIDPMTRAVQIGRHPERVKKELPLGYFLWVVAQEYLRIYEEAEKYGIWGHALSDLGFEGVVIYEGGFAEILIGS
jgi:hypothetical protein